MTRGLRRRRTATRDRARLARWADLGAKLGKDGREVRRILDPDHPTKMPTLVAALAALGRRLVIGVEAACKLRECQPRLATAYDAACSTLCQDEKLWVMKEH